jgi:hypothetical protein
MAVVEDLETLIHELESDTYQLKINYEKQKVILEEEFTKRININRIEREALQYLLEKAKKDNFIF